MDTTPTRKPPEVGTEDVARWFTFGGFWGFVFYLLSIVGITLGHRRQPVRINTQTTLTGMGIYVGGFISYTSLYSTVKSFTQGKSISKIARERIRGGSLDRPLWQFAAGGGVFSIFPFLLAVLTLRLAEGITGEPAFEDSDYINWPQAAGTTALLSGLAALVVTRITSWVARDAREEVPQPTDD